MRPCPCGDSADSPALISGAQVAPASIAAMPRFVPRSVHGYVPLFPAVQVLIAGRFGTTILATVTCRSTVREVQRGRIPQSALAITVNINTISFDLMDSEHIFVSPTACLPCISPPARVSGGIVQCCVPSSVLCPSVNAVSPVIAVSPVNAVSPVSALCPPSVLCPRSVLLCRGGCRLNRRIHSWHEVCTCSA